MRPEMVTWALPLRTPEDQSESDHEYPSHVRVTHRGPGHAMIMAVHERGKARDTVVARCAAAWKCVLTLYVATASM
jgi:hypothetical protein